MKKTIFSVMLAVGLFLASTAAASAATYYVAPFDYTKVPCNDPATGTNEDPFKAFFLAVKVLKPGDTLLVKDGTYTEPLNNTNSEACRRVYLPSGEAGRPVTIKAQNQRRAIIKPLGGNNVATIGGATVNLHHVTIDGLVFDGANLGDQVIVGTNVNIAGNPANPAQVSNITFINNEIRNTGAKVDISRIDFNVMGTRPHQLYVNWYGFWSAALMVKDSTGHRIANNIIHHNGVTDYDHGIYQYSENTLIENNIIYNNAGTGIKAGWESGEGKKTVVKSNLLYNNCQAMYRRGANGSAPGRLSKCRNLSSHFSEDYEMLNNIVVGAYGAGIDLIYGPITNTKVYNNVVYNSGDSGIRISGGVATPGAWDVVGLQIKNNIVLATGSGAGGSAINVAHRAKDITLESNITSGSRYQIAVEPEANNIIQRNNQINVDPRFLGVPSEYLNQQYQVTDTNALVNAMQKFQLQNNSPAINKGVTLAETAIDFNGVRRPVGAAFDIGPFEFGGTPAPPPTPGNDPRDPSPTPISSGTPEPTHPGGARTVRIVNVPLSATANGLGIDAIVDNGVTYQGETSGAFSYNGNWILDHNSGYQEGRARWTRSSGAELTYQTNSTSLTLFTKFEPGTGSFDLYVDSCKVGNFSVNAPATRYGSLNLNLSSCATPLATPGKMGDANADNHVDGLDYIIWLNNFGQSRSGATNGDFNNSGGVDGLDYIIWLNNFGR